MKCLRRLFTLFVICAISFSLLSVCFAMELDGSSASDDEEVSNDVGASDDGDISGDSDDSPGADSDTEDDTSSDIGSVTVEIIPTVVDHEDDTDDADDAEVLSGDEGAEDEDSGFSGFTATGSLTLSSDDPIEVIVVQEEAVYSVSAVSDDGVDLTIGADPPASSPFYGACYVTGYDDNLGYVTVYFPSTYKTGYFGVDSNGYLFNVSASSISGYLEDAYNNSVSVASFSYPRYRISSSTSNYTYLYLIPENSNMDIATTNTPKVTASEMVPYVIVSLLGVIFLCCMKRW